MLGEIIGGIADKLFGLSEDRHDEARDDSAVQRRVADAKKAGIHPLAALGMAPVASGGSYVGDTFSSMGASLDRSFAQSSTSDDRAGDLGNKLLSAQIEGVGLENDLKRAELASKMKVMYGAGTPPVVPAVGANTAQGGDIGGQTLPMPWGMPNLRTGPTATSQEIERQYGDVVQEGYGMARLGDDLRRNYENSHTAKMREFMYRDGKKVFMDFMSQLFGINPAY